jgi:O-antigen ligase
MKFIETTFAVLIFSMALQNILLVRKYFIYFVISSILIVISFLQHIETRFVFDTDIGTYGADPSAYSIGLVLAAYLLTEENGRWLFAKANSTINWFRYATLLVVITLIFLTTSRIGFFTLIGSYLIYILVSKSSLKRLIPIIFVIFISTIYITNSKYAEIMDHWVNKTFRNEQGISGASTGRIDQWEMAGVYLISEDPLKILFGFSPGKGSEFSGYYSTKVNVIDSMYGKSYQLHSLYLNILIEYGLIAFIFLLWFFIMNWKYVYEIYKLYGVSIPLLALIGYMLYIGSVSGLGVIPGMFISLFFIKHEQLSLLS